MQLQAKMEALKISLSGAKRGGKGADPEVSTSEYQTLYLTYDVVTSNL